MGFLSNLIEHGARKIVSEAVGGVLDKVADGVNTTLKDTLDKKFPTSSENSGRLSNITETKEVAKVAKQEQSKESSAPVRPENAYHTYKEIEAPKRVRAKTDVVNLSEDTIRVCGVIEQCFVREFSNYMIRVKVSPNEIGGAEDARLYTYVMYSDNIPKLCILVTDHNRYQRNEFVLAEEAAKKAHIPMVNFFTQFPNTEEYVTKRLKENLSY